MIHPLQYISQAPRTGTHIDAIEQVLQAGGKWIQLRIKNQAEAEILPFAKAAQALCEKYGARLIVNDFPHLAKAVNSYGVHLGLQDMPISEARKIIGKHQIAGGTANTFEHILQRVAEGADYIGLGPFRFTQTKENLSPIVGLAGYHKLMEKVRKAGINTPIIAIGGIEAADIPAILETGIYGIAISAALTNQTQTAAVIEEINSKFSIHSI
ncbi:Thiamine-phosphate synthase [Pedobacter sp. Bi27]|uniref:thiamine phosphate synthase n=1 Tax=unclassified Pedobacter TaxID=2628915 RepID=UPI001DBE5D1A|nr:MULTISPECIES: thiamine phosphate synthase [unclassified Pedobacter]CAH0190928.1 Thiamine-phosphate synthase [Pedobacter sp. Bi36]CAH0214597.1 Thiamine-phosphate synthase [Pedobacter sp. Bi27]CAH0246707.1 Thiamine-phosphate synthase [Pedobacter sp. Bi126]